MMRHGYPAFTSHVDKLTGDILAEPDKLGLAENTIVILRAITDFTSEILRIGHTATGARVSTESESWDGRVIDLLSPAALDSYWNTSITPIFNALGPHAGTTMKHVHTDSWEGGGMNWTPGFDQVFRERRGYDPIPWLAVLTGQIIGSRAQSDA